MQGEKGDHPRCPVICALPPGRRCLMLIVVGLILLIAAVVVGVAGVLANGGSAHALTHGFAVVGYHVTGSTGTLFLYGIVVGAVALFGLSVLSVSYTHLRAHETDSYLVCRLLLE